MNTHKNIEISRLSDDWDHSPIELDSIDVNTEEKPINRVDEIELVHLLDKRLLIFAMFGNLVKTLDNTNLASAFISGMEEELNITGVQYNWMGVLFMMGYLTMQIPSNILLARMRPSVYLPFLEFIWCLLTIAMACAQSVNTVYVIRFLLGLAEAGFYPGIVFLIGTWYTKKELGKRLALLGICGSFGRGLSGIVQAIMLKTTDGILGISGWRWMFLFDACVTLILCSLGHKYLPDYPHNTTWLTEEERRIALHRMGKDIMHHEKEGGYHKKMDVIRALFKNKYLYMFVFGWSSLHMALGAPHVLGIVAKKLGFDAVTSNLLTTPDTILTMIVGLCNGFISDRYRTRLWCIIIPGFIGISGLSLLSAFVQPFWKLYMGFLMTHAGLGSLSSIVMTWASETISSNDEIRAMAIAIMNTSSSVMWVWIPLVLWPVTDAPYYRKNNKHRQVTSTKVSFLIYNRPRIHHGLSYGVCFLIVYDHCFFHVEERQKGK
ncbi:major facilitator superfamily domain-containing protein [Pilobolus umbonatus]|nr:major facilitator superfamily domain-containing protein [Pilobolus umbonatus]